MAQTKRPRNVQTKNTEYFESPEQLIKALRNTNPEALKNALVSFRNQITVNYDEHPSNGDARLALVTAWIEKSPGASELLEIWEARSNYTSLVLASLAHILSLLSVTPDTAIHAMGILRIIFDQNHARRLNAHLASGQTDMVLASLKLLNAAASIDPRMTFDAVTWSAKGVLKLLSHRNRTPTSQPFAYPSIRTALTTLLLSLLPLTLTLDLFTALFRGLAQDDGAVVKRILEACWEKVWCDVKVPKSSKVKVFGGLGVFIQPLYARTDPDSTESLAPADIAHHFLLALCTNPGSGICFKSKGWYPRLSGGSLEESTPEERDEDTKVGTLYNPLLLKLLRLLRPSTDARQFELAVRILATCPDLVGAYFAKSAANIGLVLEPRLSTRWITSVGFLHTVVGADIPMNSFFLEQPAHLTGTKVYRADPPPPNIIVESIVPSVLSRTWLAKGLQAKSTPLVQHTTIRLLTRCLMKLSAVLESFPDEWATGAAEVVHLVRKRVPDIGVVVGIAQEYTKVLAENREDERDGKHVLLAESALRLLWLYMRALPSALAEVRFDIGKLLQEAEVQQEGGRNGMRAMCLVHVLRLLSESDQFVWSAKSAGSPHTHMYRLLSLHLRTSHRELRATSAALIVRLLSSSVLFEHDPREARAWIDALPQNSDDITGFLQFFDDVLCRCIKTPYRYLESRKELHAGSDISRMPSPLLMAILEQLKHKPTELAAVACVARVMRSIVGKLDFGYATGVVRYMRELFLPQGARSRGLKIVNRLDVFLDGLKLGRSESIEVDSDLAVTKFVKQMKHTETGQDEISRTQAALDVLEWFRTFEGRIGEPEVSAFAGLLSRWSTDGIALREFVEELDIRVYPAVVWGIPVIPFSLAVWALLCHGSNVPRAKKVLADSLSQLPDEQLVWSCGVVAHSLETAIQAQSRDSISDCLVALELIACRAAGTSHATEVRQALFGEMTTVKTLFFESGWVAHVKIIVSYLLSSERIEDCALAYPYWEHWSKVLLENRDQQRFEECIDELVPWIPFVSHIACLQLLQTSLDLAEDWAAVSESVGVLLDQLAQRLCSSVLTKNISVQLVNTLPRLIRVPAIARYHNLLKLAPIIAERELPFGLSLSEPNSGSLMDLTEQALNRWATTTGALSVLSWDGFSGWIDTPELARLSTVLMYLSTNARTAFSKWVSDQSSLPARAIGPSFALVDCQAAFARVTPDQMSLADTALDRILGCAARILFKHGEQHEYQLRATRTLVNCVQAFPNEIERTARSIVKRLPSDPRNVVQAHVFDFVSWVASRSSRWKELVESVVDLALLWLVRRFAEDETDSSELLRAIHSFESLLSQASDVKSHLVEPVLVAAIKNRLGVTAVAKLSSLLVDRTPLKPATVNRLLQSVVHHASFATVCQASSPARDRTIGLLRSLFLKHPSSTCHPSHVVPLLGIYYGTLDPSDTKVLSIFQLFEQHRRISTLDIIRNWKPHMSHTPPQNLVDTVCNFDPFLVFRTCTSFPQRRGLKTGEVAGSECKADIYDPIFVLLLLAALMAGDEPITDLQWLDVCSTNVLSLAVCSLSSKRPAVRRLGYASLVTAYLRIVDMEFQERAQLVYILEMLRNLLPIPSTTSTETIPRLSTYTTLLFAHAIRSLFAPFTPLYPLISRFLLQRPEFDPTDVPMLYTLLYSSSGEWKRERGWVLRFLADGMRSSEDWKVLKRRHTWDLLASLFQAATQDRALRISILEVLVNASANKYAATSLLLNSNILSWIHMQLDSTLTGEHLAYLKIIENMVIVVDHEQIDRATAGHWRDTAAQITCRIIKNHGPESGLTYLASRILVRLTSAGATTPPSIVALIRTILEHLYSYESGISVLDCRSSDVIASGPESLHYSRDLLQSVPGTTASHWSLSIRALWRVIVSMDSALLDAWDSLSSRILLISGTHATSDLQEVEWVRHRLVEVLITN